LIVKASISQFPTNYNSKAAYKNNFILSTARQLQVLSFKLKTVHPTKREKEQPP